MDDACGKFTVRPILVKSSDAEILQEFIEREKRWLQTLHALRAYHETQMGKVTTGVQWMAGRELGRVSWLGFYWHREMFWFGYGLFNGVWRPLIEADNRSKHSAVVEAMRTELSGAWETVTAEGNLYCRLWSAAEMAGETESELGWFQARSRELHEYAVPPGS